MSDLIPPEELLIEVYPPRAFGGQHVSMTISGIKITHIPTDTVAISTLARSQHRNRAIALDMIASALTHPFS